MNITKITIITVTSLVLIGLCTAAIANIKPHMHKMIMLEQIIYKRAK